MTDVDDLIHFIKSLKRGFDKDLFQSKIEELAHVVDTSGLEYDDFHTLFKLWLNLLIPITKWVSLGMCLVPRDQVEERTVDYAFRWLLASCGNHSNFSRMAFVLDWLTAAMDSDTVDRNILDYGYEIFYTMLSFEVLTAHTVKLVYTLTKPTDVNRRRVLELIDCAQKREGKKNMHRQIQVLLGLFKSYKPECVPEDIPAISIHTSFKKINASLLARFRKNQERRNTFSKERCHLLWINPFNSVSGINRKAEPLVPNMEFLHIGSKQYSDKKPQKNYLDFSEPVFLLQYSLQQPAVRPARLRSLLRNDTGLTLLAVATDNEQAFFSHDLYHLLSSCFLDASPYSYEEKLDLLNRLALLQRTLMQAIPVVTRFLAQYLPLWNEKDFFGEILELIQWIHLDADLVPYIVDPLSKAYHRAHPVRQCAILKSLTTMYTNLVYASTRRRHHFTTSQLQDFSLLPQIAANITHMGAKGLQVSPDDMRVLYSSVSASERMARAELRSCVAAGSLPAPITLALPLLAPHAVLYDKIAALLILYKKIFSAMKSNKLGTDQAYIEYRHTLERYGADVISCLYHEDVFSSGKPGLVFQKLNPNLISKLIDLIPDASAKFSLRNNLAFNLYTFMPLEAAVSLVASNGDLSDAANENKLCFQNVIKQDFPNLGQFLMKCVPELRSV